MTMSAHTLVLLIASISVSCTVISMDPGYDLTTRRILGSCLVGCWSATALSILKDFINHTY